MINFYRRHRPKLSVCRLVDSKSSAPSLRYIGFRINLVFWALEVIHD